MPSKPPKTNHSLRVRAHLWFFGSKGGLWRAMRKLSLRSSSWYGVRGASSLTLPVSSSNSTLRGHRGGGQRESEVRAEETHWRSSALAPV